VFTHYQNNKNQKVDILVVIPFNILLLLVVVVAEIVLQMGQIIFTAVVVVAADYWQARQH
jgi:hypothetical protein